MQTLDVDAVVGGPWPWTMGFLANMESPATGKDSGRKRYGPSDAAFGKDGHGGQVAFADPEHRVAVGFVRNHHNLTDPTARELIGALYTSLGVRVTPDGSVRMMTWQTLPRRRKGSAQDLAGQVLQPSSDPANMR